MCINLMHTCVLPFLFISFHCIYFMVFTFSSGFPLFGLSLVLWLVLVIHFILWWSIYPFIGVGAGSTFSLILLYFIYPYVSVGAGSTFSLTIYWVIMVKSPCIIVFNVLVRCLLLFSYRRLLLWLLLYTWSS